MKIICYNIAYCNQIKIDHLLSMDADYYIVPEMAEPRLLTIPDGYESKWVGLYPQKGLGVIWRKTLEVKELPITIEQNFFIPLLVENKLIVAAWPTKRGVSEKLAYPKIAMLAFKQLAKYIDKYQTLITGDFNCYKGQSGETKAFSIESIDSVLNEHGLHSLYHWLNKEEIGKESLCTYHHMNKPDDNMRFFIDYTYTNIQVKGFRINDWEPEISDHLSQTIII